MSPVAVKVTDLSFSYREHKALDRVSFEVPSGQIFGLLGPNGSGKSTLFKVLSTMLRPTQGSVSILGLNPVEDDAKVRKLLGVVFQSFGLDSKLTVAENLLYQGRLYGLSGQELVRRIDDILEHLGLAGRRGERVERLSGGLQRRVELAKGILHQPKVVLMDEPSTGLDPGARIDFWNYLLEVRSTTRATILLTTHILDEADKCDSLAILDEGRIVAEGSPGELKSRIGGDVISIRSQFVELLLGEIKNMFQINPLLVDAVLRVEMQDGHRFLPKLIEAFPGKIESATIGKPTLEDVFIQVTGHKFWTDTNNRQSSE